MTIRIQVTSESTEPTRYTSKRTGKPDQEQSAWAFLVTRDGVIDDHPTKIKFIVERPYPVGDYTLHPSSFWVGDFAKLACNVRLAPLKAKNV